MAGRNVLHIRTSALLNTLLNYLLDFCSTERTFRSIRVLSRALRFQVSKSKQQWQMVIQVRDPEHAESAKPNQAEHGTRKTQCSSNDGCRWRVGNLREGIAVRGSASLLQQTDKLIIFPQNRGSASLALQVGQWSRRLHTAGSPHGRVTKASAHGGNQLGGSTGTEFKVAMRFSRNSTAAAARSGQ